MTSEHNADLRQRALRIYLILAALFIASLVACNLIFRKFFHWSPIEGLTFEQSVGRLGTKNSSVASENSCDSQDDFDNSGMQQQSVSATES